MEIFRRKVPQTITPEEYPYHPTEQHTVKLLNGNGIPLYDIAYHDDILNPLDRFVKKLPKGSEHVHISFDDHSDLGVAGPPHDINFLGFRSRFPITEANWVHEAMYRGTIERNGGYYWLFRENTPEPSDYGMQDGGVWVHSNGTDVAMINIDRVQVEGSESRRLFEGLLQRVADPKTFMSAGVDADLGMMQVPHRQWGNRYEIRRGVYRVDKWKIEDPDIDLLENEIVLQVLGLADARMLIRSPGYCFQPYADYIGERLQTMHMEGGLDR